MCFERAEWIWTSEKRAEISEYADFCAVFTIDGDPTYKGRGDVSLPLENGGERPSSTVSAAVMRISAEADYVAFLNGKLVGFNQYRDFPDEKVYDVYDVEDVLQTGDNTLCVTALSKNYETASHVAGGKGVIFEIVRGELIVVSSTADTLSRINPCYRSGEVRQITGQLGFGFHYDLTKEDGFPCAAADGSTLARRGFRSSVVSRSKGAFSVRPIDQMTIAAAPDPRKVREGLYDLGREMCGYLTFELVAAKDCDLIVAYGEHLADGGVLRIIHSRDFSVSFRLKRGVNVFSEYFLRFGLRYLELESTAPVTVKRIGINHAVYPVHTVSTPRSRIRADIYRVAVDTLVNCMHEHYEDCPWREQAMYAMDSRTQMLCGYDAFKEFRFARAALKLMIHAPRADGSLRLTSPSMTPLSIGSFSLVYVLAVLEYVRASGDRDILDALLPDIRRLIDGFCRQTIHGLLPMLPLWNFFEWSEGLSNDGQINAPESNPDRFALPLNAFFAVALDAYAELATVAGQDGTQYAARAEEVRGRIHQMFYHAQRKLYASYAERGTLSNFAEYSNVLAVYCGAATGAHKRALLDVLTSDNDLLPLSLSNYIYKYEILLREDGYDDLIADEINSIWGEMIDRGATTFWETQKGEADFDGAGSLCHGWSAVPVWCAHRLVERNA